MAKTSLQCRRRLQSSAGLPSNGLRCGMNSMRASSDEDSNQRLDLGIKQAIQRCGGKQVQAFVVMALHDDGDISTHTTDHVSRCTNSIFTSDAEERLRFAHRKSILEANTSEGHLDRDLIFQSTFEVTSSQESLLEGENNRMVESQSGESLYDLSRPISPLSYGGANTWHSNFNEMESHGRSQSESTGNAHFESLTICESAKVEDFLVQRFRSMQQLAVKRIAKAWIKGICPKKQATFPYHKKKREREGLDHLTGCIPGWWPDTSICRFVEPDHIKRDERINLCLHLLRLRPTPAELKEWNKGCVEPHQTHVIKGWTEFLKELAPPGIFDDMREPEGKEQQERQKLLAQIYELSKKEEEYENGDIDGEDAYYWQADGADDKPAYRKKNPRGWDLSVDDSGTDSYADSARASKRSKKNSSATTPAGSPVTSHQRGGDVDDSMQDFKPPPNTGFRPESYHIRSAAVSPQESWTVDDSENPVLVHPMQDQAGSLQDISRMPQGYTHGSCSSWVDASSSAPFSEPERRAISQAFAMDVPASVFQGRQFQYPHQNFEQDQHQVSPAYMTTELPQPQFEDMSVTGLYTPPMLSHAPHPRQRHDPYINAAYYCQPVGAQYFATSDTLGANPQLDMTAPHNLATKYCTAGPEQYCTVDPANYRHHPETGHPGDQYPEYRHGGPDFQAPARVERGFTGHGSGVGGGAHT